MPLRCLLTFGMLTLLSASLPGVGMQLFSPTFFYWLIAGPIGFFLVGWRYRRNQITNGVGTAGAGRTQPWG
jgi:hypothetical protein